ncbi:hypothetical protein PSH79_12750 [Pseudomonas sp. FP2196]|uniref:hypothetical protein n=1 Tax=Pseudomonas sp. FP2196 TaxID=2954086 RepID=UPI002732AC8F|nr:hypothetical protein [Pseudomonas sp. FP2196]WLH38113.1 hypothetical protein PSH79_12750 [Pseudomonas sp. FP2196]
MTQHIDDETTLQIDRVNIPGCIWTVEHPENPHCGVPLSLISDGHIQLVIDPWDTQSAYDFADVLLNNSNSSAAHKTIQPGEENQRFDLQLPADLLNEGINQLRLRVKRISGNEETSEPLVVLYHTPRPAGEITGTGDNPNLLMTLPADVIANGIDADRAAIGVDITLSYVYMREHDVITLDCDGRNISHKVTAAQVTARRVVLTLTTANFWQDNPKFALRFRVVDQLGNSSGPQAIWSKTTLVDVHIRKTELDLLAPKVLEAKDANGTVLNFGRDFYSAQHATVEVNYTGSDIGQSVKVYWLGRNNTYDSEVQTVTSAGQTLQFHVPRLEVVDTLSSGAEVSYTVRLPGTDENIPSRDLDLTVTGQKHHLPEPTLNTAKNNLRVYYPTLEAAYKVRISLTVGTNRYDSAEFDITQPSYTNVSVPSSWITPNIGKQGLFNYTLKRTGTNEPIIFSWYLRVTL